MPREGRLGPKAEHHLVSVVLQVIVQALECGCTRRDDIVDFVTQRRHSIRPCGEAAAQHAPPSRTPHQRQSQRRAASSLGKPRPISDWGRAGWPRRPCSYDHVRAGLPSAHSSPNPVPCPD